MKKPATDNPDPPEQYRDFLAAFPDLGRAWEAIGKAGKSGPLDARAARLVKFALAVGAQQEGSAHAGVRKARAAGVTREELEQVIALAAGTIGLPRVVAAWGWLRDEWPAAEK
jgi:alkylhydroperoxidase/carboxymuconolactone decarboxylase family protein YurZ